MAKSTDEDHRPTAATKVIVVAGTYDGALAGYEMNLQDSSLESDGISNKLQIILASPVHEGSVRSLSCGSNSTTTACLLLSTGYDEMLKTHDFGKRLTSSGEVRTPAGFGTPMCAAFAPPYGGSTVAVINGGGGGSTHCLVGFGASTDETNTSSGGKLVIYKRRDWTVQHVLNGHDGGVASLAVHPTGKLALTGGINDGKLKLWDLERGRLAYNSSTIKTAATQVDGRKQYDSILSIVWSDEGDCYAFCYGSHVTVRDVATGKDLLDAELPSKVNQVCLIRGPEGLFVAAAGNDGSLPVLAVNSVDDEESERRAIMAIEPVDGPVAGDERFKCIQTLTGYYVVTANSGGVVSLISLQGAVSIITKSNTDEQENLDDKEEDEDDDSDDQQEPEVLAVDIIDSVLIGSGARITCLTAWTVHTNEGEVSAIDTTEIEKQPDELKEDAETKTTMKQTKGPNEKKNEVVMDSAVLQKARKLVDEAKKIQKRKRRKKEKLAKNES